MSSPNPASSPKAAGQAISQACRKQGKKRAHTSATETVEDNSVAQEAQEHEANEGEDKVTADDAGFMPSHKDKPKRPRVSNEPEMAATSAGSASSPPVSTASFMRLAVVERQLIMQCLDFRSLSRVYRCSRQMRGEALHPRAASFLVLEPPFGSCARQLQLGLHHYWREAPVDYPSCHLAHAQLPVSLTVLPFSELPPAGPDTVAAITSRLSLFSKVHHLALGNVQWTEEIALQLLQHKAFSTVRTVDVQYKFSIWVTNETVQRALFALPSLTHADLSFQLHHILPTNLAAASRLRSLSLEVESGDFRLLLPLSKLHLEQLTLRGMKVHKHSHACAIPLSQLTQLTIQRSPSVSHAHARALLSQLPALTHLRVADADAPRLLLGCGDVGQAGLPALRRCTILDSPAPTAEHVRRFLWRFPRLESLTFEFSTDIKSAGQLLQRFSRWGPPVRLDCEPFAERLQPDPQRDDQIVAQPSDYSSDRDEDPDSD